MFVGKLSRLAEELKHRTYQVATEQKEEQKERGRSTPTSGLSDKIEGDDSIDPEGNYK